jgi:hypothetical protein
LLKYVCKVLNACSIVRYSTTGVRIVKKNMYSSYSFCLVLTEQRLQFNYRYSLWQSDPYHFVIRMQIYAFTYKTEFKIYRANLLSKIQFSILDENKESFCA